MVQPDPPPVVTPADFEAVALATCIGGTLYTALATVSAAPRQDKRATAKEWHEILGHISEKAISKLEHHTQGAVITSLNQPKGNKCESCALAKA